MYSENFATCEFVGNYRDKPKTFNERPIVILLNDSQTNIQHGDSTLPTDDLCSYFNSALDEDSLDPILDNNEFSATHISTQQEHLKLNLLINYSLPYPSPSAHLYFLTESLNCY